MLVLFGAEVAFAAQHVKTYRREVEIPVVGQRFKERLALLIMLRVARAFLAGGEPPNAEAIAASLKTPVRLVNEIIYRLSKNHIVREVLLRGKNPGLLPARDIDSMSVKSVLMALDQDDEDPFSLPEPADFTGIDAEVKRLQAHAYDSFEQVTVKQLVDDHPAPQERGS
jgi:membrane protein